MKLDNRIKLDHVSFTAGAGIVFYEGSNRTALGQLFFDTQNLNYTIEIIDLVLYEKLPKTPSDNKAKVIIRSPSYNSLLFNTTAINASLISCSSLDIPRRKTMKTQISLQEGKNRLFVNLSLTIEFLTS